MAYSYERASKGMAGERPHPIKKVPGMRNTKWDSYIGRHVVVREVSVTK